MDRLDISYKDGTAHMVIDMDYFFPTSKVRLKKLLKVIALDWQHSDDLIEKMMVHIQEKIPLVETDRQTTGKKYLDCRQLVEDTEQIIKDRKRQNGLPLSKDEVKEERKKLKMYRVNMQNYLRMTRRFQREKIGRAHV